MKIKFDMSWGNSAWPKEYNSIKLSNIPDKLGYYLCFWYETLATEEYPDLGGNAEIKYILYDPFQKFKGVTWDVPIKEVYKCIIKVFTKLDEIK